MYQYIIPLHCQKYSVVDSILFIHKHFVYTFISQWTFWFPHFSYCEHVYEFWCRRGLSFVLVTHQGMALMGHMVTMFNLFRICQTISQSDCPILHSHQQCNEYSNFFTTSPTLVIFFIIATLVGMRWYLMVIWFVFPWKFFDLNIFKCTNLFLWLCIYILFKNSFPSFYVINFFIIFLSTSFIVSLFYF